MRWVPPRHTPWLAACLLGLLLSAWAGGFSFTVVMLFAIVFAAGAALIAPDPQTVTGAEPGEEPDGGDDVAEDVSPADSSG